MKRKEKRFFPLPKTELGEPKRIFSETFSAVNLLTERATAELERLKNSKKKTSNEK